MSTLRLILGDQLSQSISSLQDYDREHDVVLMAEVADEANYVRHHKQKLVLVFSAMRHFAAELEAQSIRVDYVQLEDEATAARSRARWSGRCSGMAANASSSPSRANGACWR